MEGARVAVEECLRDAAPRFLGGGGGSGRVQGLGCSAWALRSHLRPQACLGLLPALEESLGGDFWPSGWWRERSGQADRLSQDPPGRRQEPALLAKQQQAGRTFHPRLARHQGPAGMEVLWSQRPDPGKRFPDLPRA